MGRLQIKMTLGATMGVRRMMDRKRLEMGSVETSKSYEHVCKHAEQGCEASRNPTVFYNFCMYDGEGCQLKINRNGEDRPQ